MAGEMTVTIGTRVRCTNGASGWVSRVVVDPAASLATDAFPIPVARP
jgi:hypothetical protein